MKLIIAVVACMFLAAGAASATEGVRLVAQPDIAPGVAAFPRLGPGEPQATRINKALEAADARARVAASDCRLQSAGTSAEPPRVLGWTRGIAIAMRGPRYLALVTDDDADCGGMYPNAGRIALTYDLRTGQPPNWRALLPKRLVRSTTVAQAMDETPLGMVGSPALKAIYLAVARRAAERVAPVCMEALGQMAGQFMLWPDAKLGGLMAQPAGLPHAYAACGVPALLGVDMLRRHGVQAGLLDAIATAHRAGIGRATVR